MLSTNIIFIFLIIIILAVILAYFGLIRDEIITAISLLFVVGVIISPCFMEMDSLISVEGFDPRLRPQSIPFYTFRDDVQSADNVREYKWERDWNSPVYSDWAHAISPPVWTANDQYRQTLYNKVSI